MNTKLKIGIIVGSIILIIIGGVVAYVMLKPNQPVKQVSPINNSPAMPQESLDRMKEYDRINSPTTYLANLLPVDEATFKMTYAIDPARKALVFTVEPKALSLQQVQEDVQKWLLGIGLSEAQIDSLIIEYGSPIN